MMNTSMHDIWASTENGPIQTFFTDLKKFPIYYHKDNDGGGTSFGQDYLRIIGEKYPNKQFDNCFEWCSGPGFIGYSILEHGLCKRLFLADMWKPAIDDAEFTRHMLPLDYRKKVIIYLLKDIGLIPTYHKFDLIVGNPPHFLNKITKTSQNSVTNRICTDLDWQTHKNFFQNIKKNMLKTSTILIQENSEGSSIVDFEDMIKTNGFVISDVFSSTNPYYYIEVKIA